MMQPLDFNTPSNKLFFSLQCGYLSFCMLDTRLKIALSVLLIYGQYTEHTERADFIHVAGY